MITESDEDLMLQSIREYKAQQSKIPVPVKTFAQKVREVKLPVVRPVVPHNPRAPHDGNRKPYSHNTIIAIAELVSRECGLTVEELSLHTHEWKYSRPRMIAWRIMYVDAGFSLLRIGALFHMNHTSVVNGVRRVLKIPNMLVMYQHLAATLRADGTIK